MIAKASSSVIFSASTAIEAMTTSRFGLAGAHVGIGKVQAPGHCVTHTEGIGQSDGADKKYELDSIYACLYCLRIVRTRSKSLGTRGLVLTPQCRIEVVGRGAAVFQLRGQRKPQSRAP